MLSACLLENYFTYIFLFFLPISHKICFKVNVSISGFTSEKTNNQRGYKIILKSESQGPGGPRFKSWTVEHMACAVSTISRYTWLWFGSHLAQTIYVYTWRNRGTDCYCVITRSWNSDSIFHFAATGFAAGTDRLNGWSDRRGEWKAYNWWSTNLESACSCCEPVWPSACPAPPLWPQFSLSVMEIIVGFLP